MTTTLDVFIYLFIFLSFGAIVLVIILGSFAESRENILDYDDDADDRVILLNAANINDNIARTNGSSLCDLFGYGRCLGVTCFDLDDADCIARLGLVGSKLQVEDCDLVADVRTSGFGPPPIRSVVCKP